MKNKLIAIIVGIVILQSIIAGSIIYDKYSIDITSLTDTSKTIQQETITFNCDGKIKEVIGDEPDGKYDKNDLVSLALKSGCSETATDFKDSEDNYYECVGNICSFDSTEKLIEECRITDMSYDSKLNKCVEKPKEIIEKETIDESGN